MRCSSSGMNPRSGMRCQWWNLSGLQSSYSRPVTESGQRRERRKSGEIGEKSIHGGTETRRYTERGPVACGRLLTTISEADAASRLSRTQRAFRPLAPRHIDSYLECHRLGVPCSASSAAPETRHDSPTPRPDRARRPRDCRRRRFHRRRSRAGEDLPPRADRAAHDDGALRAGRHRRRHLARCPTNERQALAHLVDAARLMDSLFLRQVWAGNDALLQQLGRDVADRPVGTASAPPPTRASTTS